MSSARNHHYPRARHLCGIGATGKALTALRPNARGYKGLMYCMSCNPRFFTVAMHFSCLERMS